MNTKLMCEELRNDPELGKEYKCDLKTCRYNFVSYNCDFYKRDVFDGPANQCDRCSVKNGSVHHVGCPNETCPKCKKQQSKSCKHLFGLRSEYMIKPNHPYAYSFVDDVGHNYGNHVVAQTNIGCDLYMDDGHIPCIQNGKKFLWVDDGSIPSYFTLVHLPSSPLNENLIDWNQTY